MDSAEEPLQPNTSIIDEVKSNAMCKETDKNGTSPVESNVCHKSNGVAEAGNVDNEETSTLDALVTDNRDTVIDSSKDVSENNITDVDLNVSMVSSDSPKLIEKSEMSTGETVVEFEQDSVDVSKELVKIEVPIVDAIETVTSEEVIESVVVLNFTDSIVERVTFETEIVVENNDNDLNEKDSELNIIEDNSGDLLNELGENIELSEALRASNTTDNIENNNSTVRQEMFNKEELLDILEGNDVEESDTSFIPVVGRAESQILETQLALQQLSRLKKTKKTKSAEKQPKRRKSDKKMLPKKEAETKKEVDIVNTLVKDWDDEEPVEGNEKDQEALVEGESMSKSSDDPVKIEEDMTKDESSKISTSVDSSVSDGQSTNLTKSGDEIIPQRRLGRIIKKKVIFDPDNPDTFTKGKTTPKQKEVLHEKDLCNKSKGDETFQRSKSKSPLSKLQWKKPPPKNSKQYRRLTEVDKLLMDEGAVNMIYQLTPEAHKGKKNMKTKAEFIKKIQSSTPDSKEMKFRERKKECKSEDGSEAKKNLSAKQRPSLSSSVKSPSVYEDFEAHTADDSIIYRRHSSSSYSSSCMSPRRLSDVEVSVGNNNASLASLPNLEAQNNNTNESIETPTEVFMGEQTSTKNEIINKDDCLSIKEKLNSKLSLALNKRKRDTHKTDKPNKQKKIVKTGEKEVGGTNVVTFKYLSITIDHKLAELYIQKSIYNIEVIKELEKALQYIESIENVSVTLLMSECGTLCSSLDLKPLLDDNSETKTNYAVTIAESIRSLLCVLEQHSKLVCTGVRGSCSGVGLAMFALGDVTLASEQASFMLDSYKSTHAHEGGTLLLPSIATLVTHTRLPQALLNELVLFERRLSASDALRYGLVDRTLWPDCFIEQMRTLARDIAAQPHQSVLLKKQLLKLKKIGTKDSFQSSLERERDKLVEYWTSVEGQKLIHAAYNTD